MTEQKLRTFKLIDREGFINSNSRNKVIMGLHMDNGMFEGIVDEGGDLVPVLNNYGDVLISKEEFKFFEEVFEDEGEEFIPTLNEPCEVSRADDLETWFKFIPRAKYVPHYLKEECYVGDFQSRDVSWKVRQISAEHFVFRPIKVKKTWQEQVSEEFDIEYTTSGDFKFEHFMEEERLIEMEKRIIELSEGEE